MSTTVPSGEKDYILHTGLHSTEKMQRYSSYPTGKSFGIPRRRVKNQIMYLVVFVLIIGIIITAINVYELKQIHNDHVGLGVPMMEASADTSDNTHGKALWVWGKKVNSGYLTHILNVFSRAGYHRVEEGEYWDVLWSHDYPFVKLKEYLIDMKPHQRVNHFPGSGFVTNKVSLVTSNITHIPESFKMPKDRERFLEFSAKHQDYLWVQKGNNHRGVKITNAPDLDLSTEETFVQRYVDKPLLVDKKRFDIGIYVTITSVNPLRVYIYDGDWLVRFCPAVYYPFDPSVLDKYVVRDDYTPVWKMPSLKHMYSEMGYGFRDSLLTHLSKNGYDITKIRDTMYDTILEVYRDKEAALMKSASKYKSTSNFFEMVRFDFVIDDDLNVYLMEVNMSPNLSSGMHPPNKLLYEQVMYSMLSLVGVVRGTTQSYSKGLLDEQQMKVSTKDITVNPTMCTSSSCLDNCLHPDCKLCPGCLTVSQADIFKSSYLEHMNRQSWRRVIPQPFSSYDDALEWIPYEDQEFTKQTKSNRLLTQWYWYKCKQDALWCFG